MNRTSYEQARAWIELDMVALQHNVETLRSLLPPNCELMPAVKANAYGHGAVPISKELNLLGIHTFCVATVQEGVELRQSGISGDILILGYTQPEAFLLLARYDLTQTVVDYEYGECLNRAGFPIRVHIGIDTGMHRLGEPCANVDEIDKLFQMQNLCVEGVFSHLCVDDTDRADDIAFTLRQGKEFWNLIEELRRRGHPVPKSHLLSSYGLMNYPGLGGAYARVGIALYGVLSTRQDRKRCDVDLRPVLSLKARIASVRHVKAGDGAGYGLAFRAKQDSRIATLTIGYADGLPRALSCGVGSVLINGHKVPIVGRICMDQTLADVSEIPDVTPGQIAMIIGTSKNQTISVYDIAQQTNTITNEILSRLGTRLERTLKK